MEESKPDSTLESMKGAFVGSLVRNNKKIREDRAIAISETAQMIYKREVEDTEIKIKQLRRDREAMLDLSPTDAQSLVLASDFDAKAFVEKDITMYGSQDIPARFGSENAQVRILPPRLPVNITANVTGFDPVYDAFDSLTGYMVLLR